MHINLHVQIGIFGVAFSNRSPIHCIVTVIIPIINISIAVLLAVLSKPAMNEIFLVLVSYVIILTFLAIESCIFFASSNRYVAFNLDVFKDNELNRYKYRIPKSSPKNHRIIHFKILFSSIYFCCFLSLILSVCVHPSETRNSFIRMKKENRFIQITVFI